MTQPTIYIGQRDLQEPQHHWSLLQGPVELYTSPTILLLPGANNTARGVNGALKRLGEHFDEPDKVRLLGCFYANHEAHTYREQVQHQSGLLSDLKEGAYQSPEFRHALDFFNACFLSLISDKAGGKLPVAECCRRLQNLTIISHCYGSLVAYELDSLLHQKLKELRYLPNEIKQIHRALNFINIASRAPIGLAHSQVMHIVSLNDNFWLEDWKDGSLNALIRQMADEQSSGKKRYADNMFFQPASNETLILIPHICTQNIIKDHLISLYLEKTPQEQLTQNSQEVFAFTSRFLKGRLADNKKNLETALQEHKPFAQRLQDASFKAVFRKYRLFCLSGQTLLHKAVRENNVSLAEKLLAQPLIPKYSKDSAGHFAFYYALQNKSIPMLQTFFKHVPFFNLISLHEQNEPLWLKALESSHAEFTHRFLTAFTLRSSHQQNQILPTLKDYCLTHVATKNCTAIIPFICQTSTAEDLQYLIGLYTKADNGKTYAAKHNKKAVLNVVQKMAMSKKFYALGENSSILLLKRLKAPQIFLTLFHHYRKKYLLDKQQTMASDVNRFLMHGALFQKANLPVLSVMPQKLRTKETDFLNAVSDFILWNGDEKRTRITARLVKRYTRLTQRLIQEADKERF